MGSNDLFFLKKKWGELHFMMCYRVTVLPIP
jgi:hypothetical protein